MTTDNTNTAGSAAAERYCLFCDKKGHLTTECQSTHGFNTPANRELFRLCRAVRSAAVPAGEPVAWRYRSEEFEPWTHVHGPIRPSRPWKNILECQPLYATPPAAPSVPPVWKKGDRVQTPDGPGTITHITVPVPAIFSVHLGKGRGDAYSEKDLSPITADPPASPESDDPAVPSITSPAGVDGGSGNGIGT